MVSKHEIEGFVEELNEKATTIEDHLSQFFRDVSVHQARQGELMEPVNSWSHSDDSASAKRNAVRMHEEWQAKAEGLVDEYRPSRSEEIRSHYETIQENLTLTSHKTVSRGKKSVMNETYNAFDSQVGIVRSVVGRVEVEELQARRQISARLARDEIERAWQLFEDEFIRSAGVVASVAVERELLTKCEESEKVEEYDPTHGISRLAQTLYESEVIDKTEWNDLKAMASIREKCAHADNPEKHRVRRLINDSEDFVRS